MLPDITWVVRDLRDPPWGKLWCYSPDKRRHSAGGAPALRSSSAVGATATQASGRGVLRRSESAREQGSCAPLSLYSSRRAIDMPPELDARRIVELTQAIDALLLTSEPTPSLDEVIASAVLRRNLGDYRLLIAATTNLVDLTAGERRVCRKPGSVTTP